MSKHISTCLSPRMVRSPFLNRMVSVPCGKCDGCQNTRAFRWKKRLEDEMLCHKYVYFVTLTYDDVHLPCYRFDKDLGCLVSNRQNDDTLRCQPILSESLFDALGLQGKEIDYVLDRLDTPLGLPHVSVEDLQKFFKRFNRYIHYHVTQTYKNFIYWFVSEIGPTTHRPHYHGLIYFDADGIADRFEEILSETWSLGFCDAKPVQSESASANYVAQYLNCFANLPKVYTKFRELRPFFLCSRKTVIGSNLSSFEELQKIFFDASPRRGKPDFRSHRYLDVPLLPSLTDRLFPKIPRFSSLSDSDRITLYGLYEISNCENFEQFKKWCLYQMERIYPQGWTPNVIYSYLHAITYGGDLRVQKNVNSLYRFYCISRRVSLNSRLFGISVRDYACHILRYYERKDIYDLQQFYLFQEEYAKSHPLPDLIHCYPEFYYQYNNGGDVPYLDYVLDSFCCDYFPSFDDTFDIRSQVEVQRFIRDKNTKTHRKNEYFDKLKLTNFSLYNVINKYHSNE